MTDSTPRKKKRVRPARKIVPRGRMGVSWVVGSLALGGLIFVAGVLFLITQNR